MTSNPNREDIYQRTARIVGAALDIPVTSIHPHSSLVDDLGAESIDFLDITFGLESEFTLKISSEELWAGRVGKSTDQATIDAKVAELRQSMPDFAWDRMPAAITARDLPRLITLNTVVDYLVRRLEEAPAATV